MPAPSHTPKTTQPCCEYDYDLRISALALLLYMPDLTRHPDIAAAVGALVPPRKLEHQALPKPDRWVHLKFDEAQACKGLLPEFCGTSHASRSRTRAVGPAELEISQSRAES